MKRIRLSRKNMPKSLKDIKILIQFRRIFLILLCGLLSFNLVIAYSYVSESKAIAEISVLNSNNSANFKDLERVSLDKKDKSLTAYQFESVEISEPKLPSFEQKEKASDIQVLLREQGSLQSGDTILSSDGSLYDQYILQGYAGQSLIIDLESSDFDSYLVLLDSQNNVIAENDDMVTVHSPLKKAIRSSPRSAFTFA